MPELPEVHTILQDLNKHITGYEIKNIKISPDYKIPLEVKKRLKEIIGEKIIKAERIAKNISIKLSSNEYLVFHLAMSGRILLRAEKDIKDKWVKIVFEISKDDKIYYLKFSDMRQFGKVRVIKELEMNEFKEKYGLDVLNNKIDEKMFLKSLISKKTNIKNALMDQRIISGMGNIYATDALFLAKINPKTNTQNLDIDFAKTLLNTSREVLLEGIKNRGSTLPDKMYVDIFGNPGSQQDHFKIYGKTLCPICKSKVQFEKINGRGTYFCPTCQPLGTVSEKKNLPKIVGKQERLI